MTEKDPNRVPDPLDQLTLGTLYAYATFLAAVGFALCGIGLIGYQFLNYLETASWHPISTIDALVFAGNEWAVHPQGWLGLHNLLSATPFAFALFGLAALMIVLTD